MINLRLNIIADEDDFGLPNVHIFSDRKWVKHVYCDRSRFHVLSYHGTYAGAFISCNEPDCIVNAPMFEQQEAIRKLQE